jgi:predicted methyltransferase
MKLDLTAAAAALALLALPVLAQTPAPTVAAALADPGRPDKDKAQDAIRHPAELLAFAKVKPGETVMDIWPGGGYWTRLFSVAVGPTGKVISYVPAEIVAFKNKPLDVAKAVAAEPGRGNVMAFSDPLAAAPEAQYVNRLLDVAFTFENYHDLHDSFMKGADVDAFNKAVFALLKPGGYYVIVDHAAPPGSGLKHTEDLHRIDSASVRAEVEKAGFRFDGETKILANPDDPKDKIVFDPSIRGKTDRFAYRFVKPQV